MQESTNPLWLQRYLDEFLTLDQVGDLENITREGVRQRLKGLGITPRTNTETRKLQEARETSRLGKEIEVAFLRTRSIEDTSEAVGLRSAWVVRHLEKSIPDYKILTRLPRETPKRYSAAELIASLRGAASAEPSQNLSASAYEHYVRDNPALKDGRPTPGKQAMWLRYGSWRGALEAAGLPANPHSGPSKAFEESQALSAVVACWRALGSPPTAGIYDEWQRGVAGQPSAATINKLTGSWSTLLVRAWQLVHGIALDQNDETVIVPLPLLEQVHDIPTGFVLYRAANDATEISLPSEFATANYKALERAVRSHAIIQNALAVAGEAVGFKALTPSIHGPLFDLGFARDGALLFVVEVKSATPENLELQLRIGLGQVLRYVHQLRPTNPSVAPVIAIELHPDDAWVQLFISLGVHLVVADSIQDDLKALAIGRAD